MKHQAGKKSDLELKATPSFEFAGVAEFKVILRLVLLVACAWPFTPRLLAQAEKTDFVEIQKLFMRATEAEKAGDLDGAARQYQEILRLRPDMAEIHNKLGFIYFLQNRYPEAIQAFKNALHLKPEFFPSNLGLGMSLFRYNAFEEAVSPLQKARTFNPTDPQTIFFLGSSYLSLQRFEDAVPLFLQFARVAPEDQDGLFALTLAAEQLYVKCFVDLASLYPDSARAHQVLGQRLVASKKWDEAVAEFQKVSAISPRLEQIHLALGDIYAEQGLAAQAKAEYEKELDINPFDPLAQRGLEKVGLRAAAGANPAKPIPAPSSFGTETATFSRVQVLVQSAQCSQAIDLMKSMPEKDSSSAVPWQWKVKCLLQMGEFESLLAVLSHLPLNDSDVLYWKGLSMQQLTSKSYEALARLEPDSARIHELAGRLAEERDDEPTALREFKLAAERDPDLPGIHYAIGHILMRNRQLEEAREEFRAELKSDPYNPFVQCELGSVYLNLREPDQSIPLLEAGLARRPDLVDAHRDLGRAYGQKGNWEKAISQFQLVAAARPADYSIHMLIGDACRRLGRMADAEAEFRKGRELQAADMSKTQGLAKTILNPNQPKDSPPPSQSPPPDNKGSH